MEAWLCCSRCALRRRRQRRLLCALPRQGCLFIAGLPASGGSGRQRHWRWQRQRRWRLWSQEQQGHGLLVGLKVYGACRACWMPACGALSAVGAGLRVQPPVLLGKRLFRLREWPCPLNDSPGRAASCMRGVQGLSLLVSLQHLATSQQGVASQPPPSQPPPNPSFPFCPSPAPCCTPPGQLCSACWSWRCQLPTPRPTGALPAGAAGACHRRSRAPAHRPAGAAYHAPLHPAHRYLSAALLRAAHSVPASRCPSAGASVTRASSQ